jgi:hypothetical protein
MRITTQYKDIKIGLCFSYLDAEKEIPRALDPWYPHVDHIIAVNGRYWTPQTPEMKKKHYSPFSTDNSYQILKERYDDKLTHADFYGNQLEKRQKSFDIAAELGCEIVIVVDSDDYIHPDFQDWNKFYKRLAHIYEYNPDEYTFKMYYWIPNFSDWTPQYNEVSPQSWVKYDRIHKDPGNLRYTQNHYTWCNKDVTDEQINEWRWSHEASPEADNPLYKLGKIMIDGVRFTTNRNLRTRDHLEFGDGWTFQNMHWETFEHILKPDAHHQGLSYEFEYLQTQYPNLEYYFGPPDSEDKSPLIPYYLDEKGRYVIIKPDRTIQYAD